MSTEKPAIDFEEEIISIDKHWRIRASRIDGFPESIAAIPAFYGDGLLLMKDNLVGRYVQELFDTRFGKFNSCSPAHIKLKSWLFSRAHPCRVDKGGMVTVPAKLRDRISGGKTIIAYFEKPYPDAAETPTWVTGRLFGLCRSKTYSRGRVRIPMRFRRLLPDSVRAAPSLLGDSTWIFQGERSCWDYIDGILEDRFGGYDPNDQDQLASKSYLMGQFFDFDIPKDSTLSIAGTPLGNPTDTEIVLVGAGDHIEVYSEDVWRTIEVESQLLL